MGKFLDFGTDRDMERMHNLIVEFSKILVSQEVNVANSTASDILSLITFMHANVFLNMI